jgi:HK97 family phage major capsid protein
MSTDVNNRIRQMGVTNVFHAYTVALPAGAADQLMNRPVYTSSYYPDFTGTSGAANILTVGDLSQYVVARRSLMRVELVPHLLGTTSNRPTGQRGFFAWARVGGGSTADNAHRLLQNQ